MGAHSYSFGALVKRWLHRHKAVATTVAVGLLLAITGAALFLVRERGLRRTAERAQVEAEAARADAVNQGAAAKRNYLGLLVEQGRTELLAGRPASASAYLAEAYAMGENGVAVRSLLPDAVGLLVRSVALVGHTLVRDASFSPDGERVVTAAPDGSVRVWDARTGKTLLTLTGQAAGVVYARFSPDGKWILTWSSDGARVWDGTTGALAATLASERVVRAADISADGRRAVTGDDGGVLRLWDVRTGKMVAETTAHVEPVFSVQLSPDGSRLVSVTGTRARLCDTAALDTALAVLDEPSSAAFDREGARLVVAMYGPEPGARILDARSGGTLAWLTGLVDLARYDDEGRIVTLNQDGTAQYWDGQTGALLHALDRRMGRLYDADISRDGRRLVSVNAGAQVWDGASGVLVASLEVPDDPPEYARFSPDGRRVLTVHGDGTVRVWELGPSRRVASFRGDPTTGIEAVFTARGARVLTMVGQDTAVVWDAATGKELRRMGDHPHSVATAAATPDGTRVLTGSRDGRATIHDVATGDVLALKDPGEATVHAAFSHDGRLVATFGGDHVGRVWDARSGALLARLEGHQEAVFSVAFNPDATRLVSASFDSTARIWDAATGRQIFKLVSDDARPSGAVFSRDGARVLTDGYGAAELWDAANGKRLATFAGDLKVAAAFSHDDGRVVTASGNKAKIWDATTGALLLTLDGHKDVVYDAAFSPDDMRVATASQDQTVKLWDVATGKVLASLEGENASQLEFSADGGRLLTFGPGARAATVWEVHLETRTPEEIRRLVRERAPYRVVNGQISLQ